MGALELSQNGQDLAAAAFAQGVADAAAAAADLKDREIQFLYAALSAGVGLTTGVNSATTRTVNMLRVGDAAIASHTWATAAESWVVTEGYVLVPDTGQYDIHYLFSADSSASGINWTFTLNAANVTVPAARQDPTFAAATSPDLVTIRARHTITSVATDDDRKIRIEAFHNSGAPRDMMITASQILIVRTPNV